MRSNWSKYFLEMCKLVASRSEDTSTKCGAVIVGKDHQILSTGYNGFPRGIKNTPERNERPIKYEFFEHSERNAIYNAARTGVSLDGSTIYITGYPCCDCVRAMIQCGIKKVVIPKVRNQDDFEVRWADKIETAKGMLAEAGIDLCCL